MLRSSRKVCTKGHEFVARDEIYQGIIRRVCRWCPAVSIAAIDSDYSKPRWAAPWGPNDSPSPSPGDVAA